MGKNSSRKILIVTTNPFPVGLAGTNRILSYCKGFLSHGYVPEVICIRPTEPYDNIINDTANGSYMNVKYSYPGGTSIRVSSFWRRRKNDFIAKFAAICSLYQSMVKGDVRFVLFYGNCISVELSSIVLSKIFKIRTYKEESENPQIYFSRKTSFINSINRWFSIYRLYGYYNSILVMTHPLYDFFLNIGIERTKLLVVPQTVDQERFDEEIDNQEMKLPYGYIAYVGTLNQQKDGILNLVESFAEISAKYPEIHLAIAGDGTQLEKDSLLSLIKQLHLEMKVQFIGRIIPSDIPGFLKGAKILVSCRPASLQSNYGFPTKVVEYLACGKPTVTTATGELSIFLKDRENAFVAVTDTPSVFASKILEVLQDYSFAMKVAQNGKKLVTDKFNPIIQTKLILDFNSN